ncbi:mRNA guanylyltransferase [Nematocida displodere]|uniref:mRNA guanylyltransferase n=1 Tax=Nematocida displodere TaxID=1805483 RepID=A0A177EHI8_9MICR|nr:mRNA guanylyltransferase [Nematocida displodere]
MDIEHLGIGERINARDSRNMLKEINEILSLNSTDAFPGAQPVTMARSDLESLKSEDYYVCEKSDGLRALLYIKPLNRKTYAFFIDRKCTFIRIVSQMQPVAEAMLFDGEIIEEKGGRFKYIVFDMSVYMGKSICEKNLNTRLGAASRFLYENRKWRESVQGAGGLAEEKVEIVIKIMHKSYGLDEVYRKIIPQLSHENDGLIFTCVNHTYQPGTCRAYLKWKPPHLNSIDFRLRKTAISGKYTLHVGIGGGREMAFGHYWADTLVKDLECNRDARHNQDQKESYAAEIDYLNLDGEIGEFSYKTEEYTIDPVTFDLCRERWCLLRTRNDKTAPNAYRTVVSIMHSIREDLGYKELGRAVKEIRDSWKTRDAKKRKTDESLSTKK